MQLACNRNLQASHPKAAVSRQWPPASDFSCVGVSYNRCSWRLNSAKTALQFPHREPRRPFLAAQVLSAPISTPTIPPTLVDGLCSECAHDPSFTKFYVPFCICIAEPGTAQYHRARKHFFQSSCMVRDLDFPPKGRVSPPFKLFASSATPVAYCILVSV